jgi:hypothetical protein
MSNQGIYKNLRNMKLKLRVTSAVVFVAIIGCTDGQQKVDWLEQEKTVFQMVKESYSSGVSERAGVSSTATPAQKGEKLIKAIRQHTKAIADLDPAKLYELRSPQYRRRIGREVYLQSFAEDNRAARFLNIRCIGFNKVFSPENEGCWVIYVGERPPSISSSELRYHFWVSHWLYMQENWYSITGISAEPRDHQSEIRLPEL